LSRFIEESQHTGDQSEEIVSNGGSSSYDDSNHLTVHIFSGKVSHKSDYSAKMKGLIRRAGKLINQ